jgi:hypothetical protein
MARHMGHQPLTRDSRSNLPAKGFEPLTKDSRSNPLTNCTILGPHAATVDGGDGEEEDAAIIVVGDNRGRGEWCNDGTAVPQSSTVDLHPPENVGAVVFPHGAASQPFQARRGGRDQRDDPQGG